MEQTARLSADYIDEDLERLAPAPIEQDPRWIVTQQIVAHRHFRKSPLLSKFLLYIVSKTIEGKQSQITEHEIGVQVFGRPRGYRTVEDNIVRNYARQLRKRLREHFTDEGRNYTLRIDIPLGAYVPAFLPEPASGEPASVSEDPASADVFSQLGSAHCADPLKRAPDVESRSAAPHTFPTSFALGLFVLYTAALVSMTWWITARSFLDPRSPLPRSPLWSSIFDDSRNTYIVPPDAGLNLLEDLSHRPLSLTEYIKNGYLAVPLAHFDPHSAADLRTQQFTGFANLQIVTALAHRPEYNPAHALLRFPRDLRLDDLKHANAILLGSTCSNPWASLADGAANFTIVCNAGMQGATIVNRHPRPGERASYASHWNEPAHETYAIILFAPNLSGTGHMLLLEGLDVAGTQAAAEALLHSDALQPILKLAERANGSSAPFEILLRATSIESNATGTQVIATRVH